ncbi:MAG: ATP-grasp domain-containing protein [Candidatus Moraniibacteriota bacterium]
MKNILVLFGRTGKPLAPVQDQKYRESYEKLYALAEKRGLLLSRSSLDWYDEEKRIFEQTLTYNGTGWVVRKNIVPNFIYDRSKPSLISHPSKVLLAREFPLLNDPGFTLSAGSKLQVSRLIPEFSKPYTLVNSRDELKKTLGEIISSKVVVKNDRGSGGESVVIAEREKLLQLDITFPLLVQEFVDSSHGIPGITKSYHDLRLVFINDKLIYSYIREPKKGSLLANVAQGGSMTIIEPSRLPETLTPAIVAVQKAFSKYPEKEYTIDFIFDEDGRPWILEMNTMPGIYFALGQEEWQEKYFSALLDFFDTNARESSPENKK